MITLAPFSSEVFTTVLGELFPWHSKEDLIVWLETPGFAWFPLDVREYIRTLNYPNNPWSIQEFFSVPEKPVDEVEMYYFWSSLSTLERIELKFADLKG
jgi:hypothetical protein